MLCPSTMHLRPGCSRAGDTDQGGEVSGVLGDVPHPHPLAARAAVSAVVQRVGDQPGLAEAPRDVVVAAGVLAEAMG